MSYFYVFQNHQNPARGFTFSAMRIGHFATLVLAFISSFLYQPSWVYDNFWFKADFYDSIPFTVPYIAFLLVCAVVWTGVVELFIRFVKKYC